MGSAGSPANPVVYRSIHQSRGFKNGLGRRMDRAIPFVKVSILEIPKEF
jgi:hypothetical protein